MGQRIFLFILQTIMTTPKYGLQWRVKSSIHSEFLLAHLQTISEQ